MLILLLLTVLLLTVLLLSNQKVNKAKNAAELKVQRFFVIHQMKLSYLLSNNICVRTRESVSGVICKYEAM